MTYQREHKPSSWNPPTQQKSSQFAPRPFGTQAQPKSNRPPTQTEIENEAFDQHKFEAFGLQLKQESGTITPEETQQLGVLQAKMDEFWAQRRARTQGQPNLLEILSKNAGGTPATKPATPIQPKLTENKPRDKSEQARQQEVNPLNVPASGSQVVQRQGGVDKENKTGLPDNLKAGIENLSGMAMDDVKVHYNSSKPSELGALAYTQGTDIHVEPGQERHLPHEAWHVVQQKQGRVRPTLQAKGVSINDDGGLEREADEMGAKATHIVPIQAQNYPLQKGTTNDSVQMHYMDLLMPLAEYFGVEASITAVASAMGINPGYLLTGLAAIGTLTVGWSVYQLVSYLTARAVGVQAPQPQAVGVQAPQPQVVGGQPPQPQAVGGQPPQPQVVGGQPPQPQAVGGQPPQPQVVGGQPPQPQVVEVFMGRQQLKINDNKSVSIKNLAVQIEEVNREIQQYILGKEDDKTYNLQELQAYQVLLSNDLTDLKNNPSIKNYPDLAFAWKNFLYSEHGKLMQQIVDNLKSVTELLNESYNQVYLKKKDAKPDAGTPLKITVNIGRTEYKTRELLISTIKKHTGEDTEIGQAINRMENNENVSNNKGIKRSSGGVADEPLKKLREALHCSFGMADNGCAIFFVKNDSTIEIVGLGHHVSNNAKKYDIIWASEGYPTGRFDFPGA